MAYTIINIKGMNKLLAYLKAIRDKRGIMIADTKKRSAA